MENTVKVEKFGWVYICMDLYKPNKCKVGGTRREVFDRVSETENPDYATVKAYKVPTSDVFKIEKYLHKILGGAQEHFMTGRKAEWFDYSPQQACEQIEYKLGKTLGMQDENGYVNLSSIAVIPFEEDVKNYSFRFSFKDEIAYENLVRAVIGCESKTYN